MEQHLDLSRRKALKLIAGAPMLPLGGVLAASPILAACGSDSTSAAATPAVRAAFASASFTGMAAPALSDPAAMAKTTVGSALTARFVDGSSVDYKLAYQSF